MKKLKLHSNYEIKELNPFKVNKVHSLNTHKNILSNLHYEIVLFLILVISHNFKAYLKFYKIKERNYLM